MPNSSFIFSVLSGMGLAVFTAFLTVYTNRRRREITTIRGLIAEIERNRARAIDLGVDLTNTFTTRENKTDSISPRYRDPDITSTSTEFMMSAYQTFVHSGTASQLDESTREQLEGYYNWIEKINQELRERERLRTNGKSMNNSRYNRMILQHEKAALRSLLMICSPEIYAEICSQVSTEKPRLEEFKDERQIDFNKGSHHDAIESMMKDRLNHYPLMRRLS